MLRIINIVESGIKQFNDPKKQNNHLMNSGLLTTNDHTCETGT